MIFGIKSFSNTQLGIVLFLFVMLQIGFWYHTKTIRPQLTIVDNPPSKLAADALSLGDKQWYYRILVFELSNMGDSFGRTTSLRLYDYHKLSQWFSLMDMLDPRAHAVAALASYYYSATKNTQDVVYIVDYLEKHADRDPKHKWWWYYQAAYLSNRVLKDKERALDLANKLAGLRIELPLWAKYMPIIIKHEMGKKEEIFFLLDKALKEKDKLSEIEKNFIFHFISERLKEYENELRPLMQKGANNDQ